MGRILRAYHRVKLRANAVESDCDRSSERAISKRHYREIRAMLRVQISFYGWFHANVTLTLTLHSPSSAQLLNIGGRACGWKNEMSGCSMQTWPRRMHSMQRPVRLISIFHCCLTCYVNLAAVELIGSNLFCMVAGHLQFWFQAPVDAHPCVSLYCTL